MLRYITVCCAAIVFASFGGCSAQSVKPGEIVPNIILKNIFNDPRQSIRLSDFRGKLLILDFWSPSCLGCLLALPKLDSLQQKFKDKIQILYVNQQTIEETRDFFVVRKKLHLPRGPFITGDSILNSMFPHNSLPCSVWIDSSGKFLFSTQSYNTAEWSISKYFSGEKPQLTTTVKSKYVHSFIGEQWRPSILYHSYFTHVIPGVILDGGEDVKGFTQFARWYSSAVELFKDAFSEYDKYNFDIPGRIELKVKDPFPYMRQELSDSNFNYWLEHYCYNYHLFWPEEKKDQFYKVMQSDMQRFFGLDARVVQKKVVGLALVRITKEDKLKTKGGGPIRNLDILDIRSVDPGSVRELNNQPFAVLSECLKTLCEYIFKKPFIDQSNYKGSIDFQISGHTWDNITLPELRKHLRKYGLDLIEKPMVVPVLIISE